MRILSSFTAVVLAAGVFLGSFALLVVPLFFAAMLVAGPHSDFLPDLLQPVALIVGYALLIGLPSRLAVGAYRWQVTHG